MSTSKCFKKHPSRRLPDDVIEDILVRLPVKSLLRFKCVSKSWCSLFSKPAFARANMINSSRCHQHNSLILHGDIHQLPDIVERADLLKQEDHRVLLKKLDWLLWTKKSRIWIQCCCHGILCVDLFDGESYSMILWNPRINEHKKLAAPEVFELKQLRDYIGFGYDSSINDYKVVRVLSGNPFTLSPPFIVQVLNMKSNVWRTVIKDAPYTNDIARSQLVFLDGSLYFISMKALIGSPHEHIVLRFDLAEETLQELPLPLNRTGIFGSSFFLAVLGGSLHFGSGSDLWVMNEEKCWVNLLKIDGFNNFKHVAIVLY